MAKRFIDTEVLINPSIRVTPTLYKLFWMGILTRCDHAGVWVKDFEMMSLLCGGKIQESKVIEYFGEDLVEIDGGKRYFIPKFIDFQYNGELKESVAAHKSVIKILTKYNIDYKSYATLGATLSKGLQDKDKDKDKDKDRPVKVLKTPFADNVHLFEKEHRTLLERYGQHQTDWMIKKLNNYKSSSGKTYKSDYAAINSWVVDEYQKKFPHGQSSVDKSQLNKAVRRL